MAASQARRIFIASDHGGYELKKHLIESIKKMPEYVLDLGTDSNKSCDYPDFAKKLCEAITLTEGTELLHLHLDLGILICGTGLGMCMAANKYKGIRAANCYDEHTAKMAREHNAANVLCLGGRVLGKEEAEKIVKVFLSTEFSGEERHKQRIEKMMDAEK